MIEIKFTGNTPLEALASLTAFSYHCMSNPEVSTAASRIYEEGMAAEKKKSPVPVPAPSSAVAPTTPAPVPEEPPAAEDPTGTPAPHTDPDKAPTLEEVRSAGIEASHKYGTPAIKALLEQFGAANMTALAEKDRAAFMAALKGLGENHA